MGLKQSFTSASTSASAKALRATNGPAKICNTLLHFIHVAFIQARRGLGSLALVMMLSPDVEMCKGLLNSTPEHICFASLRGGYILDSNVKLLERTLFFLICVDAHCAIYNRSLKQQKAL
jgi:hypothetical protein